jgi:RHS repeat-associated protein
VTTVHYDAAGNVVSATVTNSAITGVVSSTTSSYNALSQPTSKTEQAGTSAAQTTDFTYDKDGQQASQTDANGTSHVDRDALGRVVTAWHPDGSQDNASYDKAGHTLASSNGVTTTTYVYDPLWRVSSEQVTNTSSGAVEQTTSYAYDANGNELSPITTYADGTESGVTYTYDKLGHITGMNDGTRSYTYDKNGNLSVMGVLAGSNNAVEEDFSYDGGNRPIGLTDKVGSTSWTLHTYSYAYDGRGNPNQVLTDGVTANYVYDDANQLTQVQDSAGNLVTGYSFDANHNRTSMTTSAGLTQYAYTDGVTLQSKTDPNGKVTTYQYDAGGTLSTATYDPSGANQVTHYAYDAKNLLSEVDKPDGSKVTFTYDADGNRISKVVASGGPVPTQTMVKDVYQDGRIAYETDGAGTTLATFSYDPSGVPTSVVVGTNPNTDPRYYYVYNGHGDVVALVAADGTLAAQYGYDEYGNRISSSESFANGWTNPYRFDGLDRVRYDAETNLYWMSVRAYDPTIGRFISRDPEGRTPTGWSTQPYAYAGNNPLRNIDPSGQRYYDPDNPGFWIAAPRATTTTSGLTTTPGSNPADNPVCDAHCQDAKAQAGFTRIATIIDSVSGVVVDLVNIGANIIQLVQDINTPGFAKAKSPIERALAIGDDILGIVASFVSLISDGVTLFSEITNRDVGGVMQFVHAINAAVSLFTAAFKAFKAATHGWGMVGWLLGSGMEDAEKLAAGGAKLTILGAVMTVISLLGDVLNMNLVMQAAGLLVQAIQQGTEAYLAHVEGETPEAFCSDWMTAPFHSGFAGS